MEAAEQLPDAFDCVPLRMRLTHQSCASNWRMAKRLPRDSDRCILRCKGCAVGAVNAGEDIVDSRPVDPADRLCVRCGNPTKKLVWGVFCVGCYNRQREVRIGKNRKGTRPHLKLNIGTETLYAFVSNQVSKRVVKNINTGAEALQAAIRHGEGEAFVTWHEDITDLPSRGRRSTAPLPSG